MSDDKDVEKIDCEEELQEFDLPEQFITLISRIGELTNKIFNKPTSLEKVFPCCFKLEKNNILDIYDTISHKISQYKSEKPNFELKVFYQDKTFESYPNIESFMDAHETQSTSAQAVTMIWEAILFFENKEHKITQKIGEKYKIEILFSIPPESSEEADLWFFMFNGHPIDGEGMIQASVNHSNKIWAIEIIKHIEDFKNRIEIRPKRNKRLLYEKRQYFSKIVEKIINLCPIIPLVYVLYKNSFKQFDLIKNFNYISLSLLLFIFTMLFSSYFGRILYRRLILLRDKPVIILNEYTRNKYDNEKIMGSAVFTIITLFLLPIIINIVSILICNWLNI